MSVLTEAGWQLDRIADDLKRIDTGDPTVVVADVLVDRVDELRALRDRLWREADEGYPPAKPSESPPG